MMKLEINIHRDTGRVLMQCVDIEIYTYGVGMEDAIRDVIFYHYATGDADLRRFGELVYMQIY